MPMMAMAAEPAATVSATPPSTSPVIELRSELSSSASAAASNPGSSDRAIAEARRAMASGDFERAVRLFKPLVEAQPTQIGLANDYAYCLAKLNRDEEARKVLEQALGSNELSAEAFVNLREILAKQAAAAYSKALGKKPPNTQLALRRTGEGPPKPIPPEALAGAGTDLVGAGLVPVVVAGAGTGPSSPAAPAAPVKPAAVADSGGAKLLETLTAATRSWADAWSAKDFDAYLGFYSSTFEPQSHGSIAEWRESRRPRIVKAEKIVVQVSDFKIRPVSDKEVEMRFRQRYESGALKVNSSKTITWVQEDSGWKIRREEGR